MSGQNNKKPRSSHNAYPQWMRDRALYLRGKGKTLHEIADRLGVSRGTVSLWTRSKSSRRSSTARFDRHHAWALRMTGMPDSEIAARFGVTVNALYRALGPRSRPPKRVKPLKARNRDERIEDLRLALEHEQEVS